MTNLVIMKNEQAVTTSLDIAENFEKQHKHVIEAIESKIQSAENSAHYKSMFAEGVYQDSRNRNQKMYYMNRDGFAFIAFGFTGSRADEFKLKYIQAFNKMEQINSQPPSNTKLLLRASLEHEEKIEALETDVADLKQEINLSRSQKHRLSGLVRKNVYNALGGKRAQAYNDRNLRARLYSNHWREIKNYFDVEAYEEIPKLKFDEAIEFAELWEPSTELKILIKERNNQIPLVI